MKKIERPSNGRIRIRSSQRTIIQCDEPLGAIVVDDEGEIYYPSVLRRVR